jgi:hypothetical protein
MGDDEAQLLALVGGTVGDMTQYEEQVIQQAERSAVPLLSSATKGFSGLVQALAPSVFGGGPSDCWSHEQ